MGKYTILITNLLAMICLVIAIIYVDMIVPMFLFLILLWRIQKDYDEILNAVEQGAYKPKIQARREVAS